MSTEYPAPVRLGIIGCGGYAFELIKRIGVLPRQLQLVAATSRNLDSTGAQACSKQDIQVFQTLENLLDFAPGKIDVIVNPTPIPVHKATTLQCLEAGFPVWLEKPPAATTAEIDEMLAASRQAGKPVDIGFNSIYSDLVQKLKAELVSGVYGCVQRVRGIAGIARPESYFRRSNWAGKLKMGDSWVYDGTINNPLAHLLCNNLYLAADAHHTVAEPAEVEADLWHANAIESEDTSSIRIVTRNGVEVFSNLTLCTENGIPTLTVVDTEKAVITLRNFDRLEIEWRDGRREIRNSYMDNRMHMFLELAFQAQTGGPSLCSLAMCRPFTETVETAFSQVLARTGNIPAIDPSKIECASHGDSVAFQIKGIDEALKTAHETGTRQPMLDLLSKHGEPAVCV